jgi:hypothetical protein
MFASDRVQVQLRVLHRLLSPFELPPWQNARPFTTADVLAARAAGRLHAERIPAESLMDMDVHIARIAYLADHWRDDGSDPPLIEVLEDETVVVNDGYHRICAAIVREDETIIIDVSGYIDEAEAVFGVTIS